MIKVNSNGPANADVMIIGEAPGVEEEKAGRGFVGTSGTELTRMLHEAGILRNDCFITNVTKFRPSGNKIKNFFYTNKEAKELGIEMIKGCYPKPQIVEGLKELELEIKRVNPNIIIALGNTAMWALSEFNEVDADKGIRLPKGITTWRGSTLPSRFKRADGTPYKFVPTIHPAAILRRWDQRGDVVMDLKRVFSQQTWPEIIYPKYKFIIRPTFQQVMNTLNMLEFKIKQGPTLVANDIETRKGQIACIGLAWSKLDAICIPLMDINKPDGNYWSEYEEFEITLKLRDILSHPNCHNVGQNFLYDTQYYAHHYGYVPNTTRDTMIMQHICFPGKPRGLDYIASMYCGFYQYWKSEGKEWNPRLHSEERLWEYNCKDCVNTYEACVVLEGIIDRVGLREPFEFQMSLFYPLLHMMLRGVKISKTKRSDMSLELMDAMATREQYFLDLLDHPLNPGSSQQMARLFYGDFKLPVQKNRKTWKPSCDKESLAKLKVKEPLVAPLIERIEEWRSCAVFLRTFVGAGLENGDRLSCLFDPTGTETFRFASKKNAFRRGTNLQNVPTGEEEDEDNFTLPRIRKMFIPDSGMEIADWDLEKADAQVVAWEAEDQALKDVFRSGENLHKINAMDIFGQVNERTYKLAKMGVHLTNYGGNARTLAASLGITIKEAEYFQRRWFGAHPQIQDWHDRIQESLMTTRSVRNKFGYRRFYFDRIDGLLKEALAWIPQSTVACVINRGLKNIYDNLPEVQLLIQVHDSLVMQYPVEKRDILIPKIKEQLLITVPYDDPLIIGVNAKVSTKSWGDCEALQEAV